MNTELTRDFVVYFEFYGRKMKTTVSAKNETEAKQIVLDRVTFFNVHECHEDKSDTVFNKEVSDIFDNIMDLLNNKKKK